MTKFGFTIPDFSQTCGDGKVASFEIMKHPSSRH
jgi:hypothetical protein